MVTEEDIKDDLRRISKLRKNSVAQVKYDFLTLRDGVRMFYLFSESLNGEAEKILLCLHGLSGHSAYWTIVADYLCPRKTTVYIPDIRSHGHTEAPLGDLEDFDIVMEDLYEMVKIIKKSYPDKPLFILGESMGGVNAINYVAKHPEEIAGLILSAPGVKLARTSMLANIKMLLPIGYYALCYLFAPSKTVINIKKGRDDLGSRNPDHIEYDKTDPVHLEKMSPRFFLGFNSFRIKAAKESVKKITMPVLIFLGDHDKLVDKEGVEEFFEKLPSPDKTIKILPGGYHALFTDPVSPEIFSTIENWLNKRL